MMQIDRDESADLDFVLAALMAGAIDVGELRAWSDHAVSVLDEPPGWLFDLAYFDGPAFHVYDVIGFTPHGYKGNDDALAGIAVERGRTIDETIRTSKAARQALKRHPEVAERFRSAFPFLDF
jgi:hypothetical protein